MSATENRIVKMIFDNAQFKKAASETSTQLSAIDKQVASAGKGDGLMSMGRAMDGVRVKAGAMQVATITAIANIANRAVNAGITMAKSLTLDPIKQGFDEYELKMKSIQTILANTDGESLKSVTKTLNELNQYADKTIYNFANMTDAIGKMTTAGIDMKVATSTVQGFHNMVALSGGDATAAAGALEQFNQGLQAGVIKLMDWKSLQTRGLGSKALQESFFETAKAMGTLEEVPLDETFESWNKRVGGFNGTLESGWLTADVATKAYSVMAGEFKTVDELMKEGFSRKAAEDMLKTAKSAEESATKVRTFSGFMDTLKESIGSGWSQVFEIILGDFNEATNTFTKMSNIAGGIVGGFFDGLTAILNGFDKLGGKRNLIRALSNVAAPLVAIFRRLGELMQKVFGGGEAGAGATKFAQALEHLTRPLRILAKLINGTISPSEALVRLWEVITHGLRNMSDAVDPAIKKIESLTDKIGGLSGIFGNVSMDMPSIPDMPSLPSMPSIGSIFGGEDVAAPMAGLAGGIDMVTSSVSGLNKETKSDGGLFNPDADITGGRVRDIGTLEDQMAAAEEQTRTLGDAATPILERLKDVVMNFLESFNLEDLMASLNLAVLSTFLISFSRLMNTFSDGLQGFGEAAAGFGGIFTSVKEGIDGFAKAAQREAWAKLIIGVAIAMGILAVSLWLLSKIPIDKLITGLIGLAGIMLIMKVGVESITKAVDAMEGKGTALKMTGLSLALLALGLAILMLSAAFLVLEKVDWSAMLKGLGTIVIVMLMMERLGKAGENAAKNMVAGAFGIATIAGSMLVLAAALLLFKLVDWESMLKAGLVIGALAGVLMLLGRVPAEALAKAGGAMLATSVGMLALANALLIFGLVEWESIGKAAVMLTALTVALMLLSVVGNPVTVAGVVGLSIAMIGLATAGLIFNAVDWSSIGKLALVLGILVVAFAGFLAVMAFFTPVLIILSGFAGAIGFLALAITGLTVAFALIFPLLAMGAGAFAAFATGAAIAFAVFIQTLALQAPIIKNSFLKILQTLIDGIVEAVPMIIDGIKRLFQAVKEQFTGGEGKKTQALMGDSGKSWIEKLSDGIKAKIPLIVDKAIELGKRFLDGIIKNAGSLAAKGAELVISLIDGIASRVGGIVEAAVNLVIKFAEGIGNNIGRLATAGVKLIADFLHGLASAIRGGAGMIGGGITDVLDAMKDVGVDMVQGLINGVTEMMEDALGAIGDLASKMVAKAKDILDIFSPSRVFKSIGKFLVEGLTKGIQDNAASAITATASMVTGAIAVASEYMSRFVQDLDQQAIAAAAKAEGLRAAAEKAAAAAEKTKKNRKDDRSARALDRRATRAEARAEKRQAAADKAREAAERARQFEDSSLIERAEMRSEDAQTQIDDAKEAELNAAAKLEEAKALREQAKAKGVNKADAKKFREAADRLEAQAREQALLANTLIEAARVSAAEAMEYQRQAGVQAAAEFQARYDAAAKEDADAAAFEKLGDAEKAAERRRQSALLQAQADKDLADAKQLALTDLEGANDLADRAMENAELARNYLAEAEDYDQAVKDAEEAAKQAEDSQSIDTGGTVVNLDPTEAASIAFNDYAAQYGAGMAASAGGSVIEFNQYNTSPEYLSEGDIYRRTNNQLDFAGARLGVPA